MKRRLLHLSILGVSMLGSVMAFAQDADAQSEPAKGTVDVLKEFFIEGGPLWMSFPLICLIFGLAFVIERIIYLLTNDVNPSKFLAKFEDALNSGGVSEAKDVAANGKGPVAALAYDAASRLENGEDLASIEKGIISRGGVEAGKLDRNVSWIALFIAIAPMLGFMGTVIGMVYAFRQIKDTGSVQAAEMAGNIQIALLTTLAGLIVAIILQIFYNYITAKIDTVVNHMESSAISLVDMLKGKA